MPQNIPNAPVAWVVTYLRYAEDGEEKRKL